MTCIASIVENGVVHIMADSAGVAGLDIQTRKDKKVFTVGEAVIGFAGSFRSGQAIKNHLNLRPLYPDEDVEEFMNTEFIENVRGVLKGIGSSHNESGQDRMTAQFLVGLKGRLFFFDGDFQVGELYQNFNSIGCGDAYALGSLHATSASDLDARTRLELALTAAEEYSGGVKGPFIYLSTQDAEPPLEEAKPQPTPVKKATPKKAPAKKSSTKKAPVKKG